MNVTTLSNAATPQTMLGRLPAMLASVLDRLADPFAFATRVYVGWQFFKSGLLKIGSWETTLGLFQDEYHVPLLPPALAAVAGTAGELFFPVLLVARSLRTDRRSRPVRGQRARGGVLRARALQRGLRGRDRSALSLGLHARDARDLRPRGLVGRSLARAAARLAAALVAAQRRALPLRAVARDKAANA